MFSKLAENPYEPCCVCSKAGDVFSFRTLVLYLPTLEHKLCAFFVLNGPLSTLFNLWPHSKTSLLGILLQGRPLLPWMRTLTSLCSAGERTPSATRQSKRGSLSQSYRRKPKFLCTDNSLSLQSYCRAGNTSLPVSHNQLLGAFISSLVSTCGLIRNTH